MRPLLLLLACVLAALALGAGRAGALEGTLREDRYRSVALAGNLPFEVYLPPGYATSGERYPVLYFLHGLPAGPEAYRGVGFVTRALERAGGDAIVVAPRGARPGDTDPEYLDWGTGRNWQTALARELPAYVDAHYRTIASREGRAVLGASAGGYGAMLIALAHLRSFAVVESWSGYFHATDPSGRHELAAGPAASAHTYVPLLRGRLARLPTLLAFYVGASDTRFRAENVQLARELARDRVPFVFRVYPGAHEQSVWSAHAVEWLRLALSRLAPARQ